MSSFSYLTTLAWFVAAYCGADAARINFQNTISTEDVVRADDGSCSTPACLKLAGQIKARIDESVNPCDDFWSFACGGDIKAREPLLGDKKQESSTMTDTAYYVNDIIVELLGGEQKLFSSSRVNELFDATRHEFKQCVDKIKNKDVSVEEMKEIIEFAVGDFSEWQPGEEWQASDTAAFSGLVGKLLKSGIPSPLSFADGFNMSQPSHGRSLGICWGFDNLRYMSYGIESHIESVQKDLNKTGVEAASILPEDYNETILTPITDEFGEKTASCDSFYSADTCPSERCSWDEDKYDCLAASSGEDLKPLPFKDLAALKAWWAKEGGSAGSLVDWDVVFESFSPSVHAALTKGLEPDSPYQSMISVLPKCSSYGKDFDLAKALTAFHELGPKRALTLMRGAALNDVLSKRQYAMPAALPSLTLEAIEAQGSTAEQTCAELTSMGAPDALVSAAFIRSPRIKPDLDEKREKVRSVIKYIRAAFIKNLDDLSWLDEQTRRLAAEKAVAMGEKLLYSDWLMDEDKVASVYSGVAHYTEWKTVFARSMALQGFRKNRAFLELGHRPFNIFWAAPTQIFNMAYNSIINSILAMAAFVQPPMASSRALGASLFGKLGAIMGHEVTHGFDANGRLRDKVGDLHNWWDNQTNQHFDDKAKCFIEQIGEISLDGIKHSNCYGSCNKSNGSQIIQLPPNGTQSIAERTLSETIADVGGVGVSWLAWRAWQADNGADLPLRGLDYTPSQIFFMEQTSAFCRVSTQKHRMTQVQSDVHLLPEVRVNEALKNSIPFARAFNCPKNAPMNPDRKCRIWGAVPESEMPGKPLIRAGMSSSTTTTTSSTTTTTTAKSAAKTAACSAMLTALTLLSLWI